MEIGKYTMGTYVYSFALESNRKARLEMDMDLRYGHHILIGCEFDSVTYKMTFSYYRPMDEIIDYSLY